MPSVTLLAAAKINLLLDVVGQLPDGYHGVAMLMQSVDLCDTVTLRRADRPGIVLHCDRPGLPLDHRNIAWKAAEIFATRFLPAGFWEREGLEICIEKRIPAAAGLAGGSADGAAVLAGMRTLFSPEIRHQDTELSLREAGAAVGADVPFCLTGGLCLALDIGSVLAPLPSLPAEFTILLAKPACDVSTREAYAQIDGRFPALRHPDWTAATHLALHRNWDRLFTHCGNVFEQVIDGPARVLIKSAMREHGALLCQMSGTGPTVFGIFRDRSAAERCAEAVRPCAPTVFLCRPCETAIREAQPSLPRQRTEP
ncbi:MAG: 4-(cytidine 5'-diphospho)-2-C-methyl-D-erythritol kinase [Oscillospiraceae bacterium]|jgi:4-diphosphocytidyl-2-C-methyl-D-erythritol kinase|nr:4-(cytidine 5'-diphospho)-2-C-methyl-D-erythritol kinase [Oscillospiraceae bacterium]